VQRMTALVPIFNRGKVCILWQELTCGTASDKDVSELLQAVATRVATRTQSRPNLKGESGQMQHPCKEVNVWLQAAVQSFGICFVNLPPQLQEFNLDQVLGRKVRHINSLIPYISHSRSNTSGLRQKGSKGTCCSVLVHGLVNDLTVLRITSKSSSTGLVSSAPSSSCVSVFTSGDPVKLL